MPIAPTALAKVIMPLCAALRPNPSCSIIGSRNGMAPMPMRNSDPANTETAKVFNRISEKSSSGLSCRLDRMA